MRVVAVVSAKGGVGKTTVCANLAVALSHEGQAVMAIDLDPQNALRHHFGIAPDALEGLSRATLSATDLRTACHEMPSSVVVLPYGMVNEPDRQAFEDILAHDPTWLRQHLEGLELADDAMVILDTPPGPSVYLRQALSTANIALVVTLADAASYATLPMIEGLIETYCTGRPGFIDHAFAINQVNRLRQLSADVILTMQGSLGHRVVSMLHQDQSVSEALAYGKTVLEYDPHCQGTADFLHTARWLIQTFEQHQHQHG